MKICLINNLYKPYSRGGAEKIVELMSEGLEKDGHNIFIITTKPFLKIQKNNNKIYYIKALYYNIYKIPIFLRLFWHMADMFDIGSFLKVRSILKQEKPDAVITHNLKGIGFLIPRAIKSLGIKHIHILHDIQLLHPSGLMEYNKEEKINSIFSKLYAKICCKLFNSPNIIISPSKWLIKIHNEKKFFKNSKCVVMPNPACLAKDKSKIFQKKTNEKFKFLYVGQIENHKGIIFLINTFNNFLKNYAKNNCELIIAGSGTKIKKAKQLAKKNKFIKFLGQKNKQEIKKLMENSDCLIVPSLCYENSPTVIYEASAIGLLTIASRIGGITELIHKLGGILFTTKNKNSLMRKMEWSIKNSNKIQKITTKGKEKIKKFKTENYIKQLIFILKN